MRLLNILVTEQTLYRLALSAASGPITISSANDKTVLEWHGQQSWIKVPGDGASLKAVKAIANSHGGYTARFRRSANVNPSYQHFTLLTEQAHSKALEAVQERLRSAFDPAGIFATKSFP